MKCDKWQQEILLETSGELPERRMKALREHLEHCPDCQAFRGDSQMLEKLYRESTESITATPPFTLNRIKQEAREVSGIHRRPRHRAKPEINLWRPALVAATLMIVITAGYTLLNKPISTTPPPIAATAEDGMTAPNWDDGFDETYSEIEALLTASEDWSVSDEYSDDLDELAQELLTWETSS
jgi:hypothetical protein